VATAFDIKFAFNKHARRCLLPGAACPSASTSPISTPDRIGFPRESKPPTMPAAR
jgi:hypothetical protein